MRQLEFLLYPWEASPTLQERFALAWWNDQEWKLSSVQRAPGWLGYIRDEILPSYIGIIIISHYKDPYQPTSLMECQQGFERCSVHEKPTAESSFHSYIYELSHEPSYTSAPNRLWWVYIIIYIYHKSQRLGVCSNGWLRHSARCDWTVFGAPPTIGSMVNWHITRFQMKCVYIYKYTHSHTYFNYNQVTKLLLTYLPVNITFVCQLGFCHECFTNSTRLPISTPRDKVPKRISSGKAQWQITNVASTWGCSGTHHEIVWCFFVWEVGETQKLFERKYNIWHIYIIV